MTTVLLVEDDAWLAELEGDKLDEAGYEVIYAPHAASAVSKIDEKVPDVIVVDLLLTGTTAVPLLHELQSHPDTKNVPVVLCTGLAESLNLEDMKPYGVRRILDKTTMDADDLVAAVKVVLA